MRIALDATPLSVSTGGIRRYTEELARALAGEFPGDDFRLISDQTFSFSGPAPGNLKLITSRPLNVMERRWWLMGVQREMSRSRIDVFHGTDFSVPYLALRPSVLTLHDLSPWMDPRWHHAARRVRVRTPFLIRNGRATMVITPSETVRRQAIEKFALDAGQVVAIPEAAPAWMSPTENVDSAAEPYFLYVGTLEPRKNIPTIISAWRRVKECAPVSLVLAGRRRSDFPALEDEPGLRILGEVPDADLPGLFSGAVAVLYPSLYEGFGLPVLEAMTCGAAVVTSCDPAILEVSGGAAIHVGADDENGWVTQMRNLLSNPVEREDRKARSLERAVQFSWRKTAILTREVYAEAIRRFEQ
ncbi:MAG: glycosyltransferase family 1 protein [Bryobacteraceae bacterium]